MATNSSFPRRRIGAGVIVSAAGWVTIRLPWSSAQLIGWSLIVIGAGGLVALPLGLAIHRYASTAGILERARHRAQKNGGTATWREHHRLASKAAARKNLTTLRPYYADISWYARRRLPVTEYAFHIATEGRWRKIYSPMEEHTLAMGGARKGKSALLGCLILDAPGACVVTSTRTDLALSTMGVRAKKGPVHTFDPAGTSPLPSTIKWSVLSGCQNGTTARLRAADMIPVATGEGERWDDIARRTLAVLMHAAALRNGTMLDVLRWVSRPDADARMQVEAALLRSKATNISVWKGNSDQFFLNNARTQTSITTAVMKPLEWMLDESAYGAGLAAQDDMFSVDEMLDSNATVYMIGAASDKVAPLVSALTGEIARRARWRARQEGGRLRVPLTLVLDEAAIIAPVPLPDWSADMGGFGIILHVGCQDPAQLRQVYGADGASSFLSHIGTTLIFGGIQEMPFLEECSRKSGERDVLVETKDSDGKVILSNRRESVIAAHQIMKLEKHRVMVIREGLSACIATAPKFWERADYKLARKAGTVQPVIETAYEQGLRDEMLEEEQA